ncbi:hypothetical protein L596_009878 [Steinernema carpocapsae]|uniref:Uncharacterized protein n=1 Tax=Steinernema carpocapsae TaxID=34508 RepID=A0A4U5PGM6_STECR|nr:hypothetical protein L596_009878 [Steinernema carpocapsae]
MFFIFVFFRSPPANKKANVIAMTFLSGLLWGLLLASCVCLYLDYNTATNNYCDYGCDYGTYKLKQPGVLAACWTGFSFAGWSLLTHLTLSIVVFAEDSTKHAIKFVNFYFWSELLMITAGVIGSILLNAITLQGYSPWGIVLIATFCMKFLFVRFFAVYRALVILRKTATPAAPVTVAQPERPLPRPPQCPMPQPPTTPSEAPYDYPTFQEAQANPCCNHSEALAPPPYSEEDDGYLTPRAQKRGMP